MTTEPAKAKKPAAHGKTAKPAQKAPIKSVTAEVRRKLSVSRKLFSRLTGFSERAIANWESGETPEEPGLRRIRETERFRRGWPRSWRRRPFHSGSTRRTTPSTG